LNVKFDVRDAGNLGDLERALSAIASSGTQGIFVAPDPFLTANSSRIAEVAAHNRLPALHFSGRFAEAGGLMSYGATLEDSYRRAAKHVDKIIKGAKPADIPIEQPTRFELVITLKTAKQLGIAFPQSILLRADRVIE
jgi:putative ABC transport system substrate-binding protein